MNQVDQTPTVLTECSGEGGAMQRDCSQPYIKSCASWEMTLRIISSVSTVSHVPTLSHIPKLSPISHIPIVSHFPTVSHFPIISHVLAVSHVPI
ncbi:unnamed protein product [Arctogadus glacialis]